jgi:hypothetical protein
VAASDARLAALPEHCATVFSLELGGVDRIPSVMARTIVDKLDQMPPRSI